jgi:hypothetical protein
MDLKTSAMIDHLINQGAVVMHSIDDDGQMRYKVTEKLKEVSPDLYKKLSDQYEDHMLKLIDMGPMTMVWRLNG